MAETEQGTVLCQNCGNIARLLVVVLNPYVNGKYARTVCSRLCGEIMTRDGIAELERTGGKVGACSWTISPLLTGKDPGIIVK